MLKHEFRYLQILPLLAVMVLWSVSQSSFVSALPAGFQEFYLPLPAAQTQDIFVNIDNNPAVSNGMHYVVGVTASADNTRVYYDHWENGYGTGPTGYDELVTRRGRFTNLRAVMFLPVLVEQLPFTMVETESL
ncbi:MAG: hypothetical protein QXO75_06825 [Nitrososphaerota archaeon]